MGASEAFPHQAEIRDTPEVWKTRKMSLYFKKIILPKEPLLPEISLFIHFICHVKKQESSHYPTSAFPKESFSSSRPV